MYYRKNKYRNRKITIDGHKFDSQLEARYYQQLKLLQRAGEVERFELQPKFELLPAFFKVFYKDGSVEIVDVKGVRTQVFNIKYKLFEYRYPDLKLKIVTKKDF